jgi:hypothetical protein
MSFWKNVWGIRRLLLDELQTSFQATFENPPYRPGPKQGITQPAVHQVFNPKGGAFNLAASLLEHLNATPSSRAQQESVLQASRGGGGAGSERAGECLLSLMVMKQDVDQQREGGV